MKAKLQEKMKFVESVKTRHQEEVNSYQNFCEYLEPDMLEGKLR